MEKTKSSDLPLVAIDYIDLVIKAMKYRKKIRADVRKELIAHFTDSLADCQAKDEKQKAAEELIAEFGDVKILGKLLHRAKRRCRPLWRTMVARTFQLMGILFLLLVLYIGWFFTGKPVITTNYLEILNQQVRPVADDSQNAWPFYKQAAEKYIKYEKEDFDFHPASPSPFMRSEQDRQIIQKSIRDNQESLYLIRQGNQKPYYWQIYDIGEGENELLGVLLPHLSDYKKMTYLMCWQGLLNAEQGDFEKAFSNLLEAYSFGQHLRGQSTTIEQLVAMAFEGMSTNTLRIILAEYDEQIDARLLNSVRERFGAMIANADFAVNFDSEKLFMYDEAQRCFARPRFGKSHLYLPRLKVLGVGPNDETEIFLKYGLSILFNHPDKNETLRDIERFHVEMEKIAALTPASVKSQPLNTNEFIEEAIDNNIFLAILLPALSKVNQIAWRGRAESQAMLVILAVMQYEKEHGQFPESLDVLVDKGLLNKVPIDPFSDQPLVYKKTDDGFVIYSVGYNFTDDGGVPGQYKGTNKNPQARRWANDGDAVFWPLEKSVN